MADETNTSQDAAQPVVTSTPASSARTPEQPPAQRRTYTTPPWMPACEGPEGIRYDFNYGMRLYIPDNGRYYTCTLMDVDSGSVLHYAPCTPGSVINSCKKYYMKYRIRVQEKDRVVFDHTLDLRDKEVLVQMPYEGAVGDSIAWFSICERFRLQNKCKLHVLMPPFLVDIVKANYPEITFETPESARKLKPYATYYIGLYFKGDVDWQPYDFRLCSLSEQAAYILDVKDMHEQPPLVTIGGRPEGHEKPYVCIATHGSAHAKHWCNPKGWQQVVDNLNRRGYEVIAIDKEQDVGVGDVWHYMPRGVTDCTGSRPFQERIDMIGHAAFFIGLSSGLSWVAWMCRVPIVLISGICGPRGEFQTPYRVQARHTCHGCWNDTRYEFDHHDFMWCPRFKGQPQAYECTKMISAEMVLAAIDRIPGVLPRPANPQ